MEDSAVKRLLRDNNVLIDPHDRRPAIEIAQFLGLLTKQEVIVAVVPEMPSCEV